MNPEELKRGLADYAGKELAQRKRWYSPAAAAYDRARPRYPRELIRRVAELAHLAPDSRILEVGCGPGTATTAFAEMGCALCCLEPNPDFYRLAQQRCTAYPKVEIRNSAFEEWSCEEKAFDAVLAASSWHWIPAELAYPKAAAALRADGALILLWNEQLQPPRAVYQRLAEVYRAHAPALARYEDRAAQEETLAGLGQLIIDSGRFQDLVYEAVSVDLTYTADEYLLLLSTYSPYLALEAGHRQALFDALGRVIVQDFGGNLPLTHLSAGHVARKC